VKAKDIVFLPLRVLLDHESLRSLGLTSVLDERVEVCFRYAREPILDIGCGVGNPFIRMKNLRGLGIDNYPYPELDVRADAVHLPFPDRSFNCISFIGSLNYVEDPLAAIRESARVLSDEGVLLITVTGERWSRLRHALAWWKPKRYEIARDGRFGFSEDELVGLLAGGGFSVREKVPYLLGISTLFVARKRSADGRCPG
jgi:SAM-dependent methyltransferase